MTGRYHSPGLDAVTICDAFWVLRLKTNDLVSLDHQYDLLQAKGSPDEPGEYEGLWAQDHKPVRERRHVEGHTVGAGNLYAAVAACLQEVDDEELFTAVERLWQNMVTRRMYVTGGIGSSPDSESFTEGYDLPNDTACAETCAAIGSIFWNQRLFEETGAAKYARPHRAAAISE